MTATDPLIRSTSMVIRGIVGSDLPDELGTYRTPITTGASTEASGVAFADQSTEALAGSYQKVDGWAARG